MTCLMLLPLLPYVYIHTIYTSTIGVSTDAVPREDSDDFLRQLQRDALWSDPSPSPGLHLNPRGIYIHDYSTCMSVVTSTISVLTLLVCVYVCFVNLCIVMHAYMYLFMYV